MIRTIVKKSALALTLGLFVLAGLPSRAQAFSLDEVLPINKVLYGDRETTESPKDTLSDADSVPSKKSDVAAESTVADDAELFTPLREVVQQTPDEVIPLAFRDVIGISSFYSKFHPGIDIRAKVGSSIHSIHAGTITTVAYEAYGYGRYVIVESQIEGATIQTLYAHMKVAKVEVGQQVETGSTIGEVGMTGRSTGPHLHFEVRKNSVAIDPIKFFSRTVSKQIAKAM